MEAAPPPLADARRQAKYSYGIITARKTYLILSAAFLAIEGSTLYSKPDPPNVMISI